MRTMYSYAYQFSQSYQGDYLVFGTACDIL
jgi:hypothetical protein